MNKKTVLIADDDVITRKVLKMMCQSMGYKVVESVNGKQALQTLRRKKIEIVVSDWIMPELSGLSLCEEIHSKDAESSPFVFLITSKKKGLRNYAEALAAGADDFLYKPVDFHVFRNQMNAAEEALAGRMTDKSKN